MEVWGRCRSQQNGGEPLENIGKSNLQTDCALNCETLQVKGKPRHGEGKRRSRANIGPNSTFVLNYAVGQPSLHAVRRCQTCVSYFLAQADKLFGTHWHANTTLPATPGIL